MILATSKTLLDPTRWAEGFNMLSPQVRLGVFILLGMALVVAGIKFWRRGKE